MTKKTIFIAFAMKDESQRNLLRGQALHTNSPFEYIDMSVKDAYNTDWKKRVRTRIRRSDGVIALVSRNSLSSSGQKWEVECAKEEKVRLLGMWVYENDRTKPTFLSGHRIIPWSWSGIASFINSL